MAVSEPGLPIRAVSQMTGLSQHAIRAWEKRYGVVDPDRTGTNRRLYTRGDVEKLLLLKRAAEQGHSLAQVALLPVEALRELVGEAQRPASLTERNVGLAALAIRAMMAMDADQLETALDHAFMTLGVDDAIDEVVIALLLAIDAGWASGTVSVAQEHLASAVIRSVLHRVQRTLMVPSGARRIVMTTLPGELHELGAMIVAVTAAKRGWNVVYLGPNIPTAEIAAAALAARADAIGLSVVSPRDQSGLQADIRAIRQNVGPKMQILIGGRASVGSMAEIRDPAIHEIHELALLRAFLEKV